MLAARRRASTGPSWSPHRGQGRSWPTGAAPRRLAQGPTRQAGVHPQGNGKKRPLGIPVIFDRALQAQVVNALEPEWEARFEPKSYGFRPGRGCHDAIEAILPGRQGPSPKRRWVLDADLAAAFDRIDHSPSSRQLGTFPARGTGRAVAEGGRGRQRSLHPDRGGNSSGRGDQPRAA
jgi:RNA-directed DNA polymerase